AAHPPGDRVRDPGQRDDTDGRAQRGVDPDPPSAEGVLLGEAHRRVLFLDDGIHAFRSISYAKAVANGRSSKMTEPASSAQRSRSRVFPSRPRSTVSSSPPGGPSSTSTPAARARETNAARSP